MLLRNRSAKLWPSVKGRSIGTAEAAVRQSENDPV
jgi:hypothetical protein